MYFYTVIRNFEKLRRLRYIYVL